jgi:hypothetical protein
VPDARSFPPAETLTPERARELGHELGLRGDEYDRVVETLGRTPTVAELGMYSVMWSEHCSYKSSKIHLQDLPTDGPQVLVGPGENAGVVDVGDGLAVDLQDRVAQPPELRRALPGGGDRGRRHPARHLHHGGAADRGHGPAALR